jgi:hypothetical protein
MSPPAPGLEAAGFPCFRCALRDLDDADVRNRKPSSALSNMTTRMRGGAVNRVQRFVIRKSPPGFLETFCWSLVTWVS